MIKGLMLVGSEEKAGTMKDVALSKKMFSQGGVAVELVEAGAIAVMIGAGDTDALWIGGEKREWPDFVMNGPVMGTDYYHLGAVLRMFENHGVLCVNPARTLEITRDKLLTYQLAEAAIPGLPLIRTLLVGRSVTADELMDRLGLPLVLKVAHGSQGIGVTLIETREALEEALADYAAGGTGDELLAQEAILTSRGRDLRMVVGAGEVIHSYVRINDNGFRSNVHQGGRIETFTPSAELAERTVRLAEMADIQYGSVDYLFGEDPDGFILCELNSVPGASFLRQALGQGNEALLKKFVGLPARLMARHRAAGGRLE